MLNVIIIIPLAGSIVVIACAALIVRINIRKKRGPKAAPVMVKVSKESMPAIVTLSKESIPATVTVSKESTIKTVPLSEAQLAALREVTPKQNISRISPRLGICASCGEKKYLVIRVEDKRFCYLCAEKKGYVGQKSQQMPVPKEESKD
jgi:hypothetical protein